MTDPLPCPFCGSEDVGWIWQARDLTGKLVFLCHCHACKANGPAEDTREEAIAAWNMEQEILREADK